MGSNNDTDEILNVQDADAEGDNLYIRIWELLKLEKYTEAEQILDDHLFLEAFSGEGILAWTELQVCQGKLEEATQKLLPLVRVFPEDPYYNLAVALFLVDISQGSPQDFEQFEISLHGIADSVDDLPEMAADVLAKVSFVATVRGMWSLGMFYFLEAMKAAEEELNLVDFSEVALLSETNDASLELYLKSLQPFDGRRLFGYSFEDVSLELVVQTICILLIGYQDLGIPEAGPIAASLALRHRVTKEEWCNLTPLYSKFCPTWISQQLTVDENHSASSSASIHIPCEVQESSHGQVTISEFYYTPPSVRVIDSRHERPNRFPKTQEGERESLYTRIVNLIFQKQCAEAERLLDEELLANPDSGEAILCWTELKLYQGDLAAVIDRVLPLNATSLNIYYMLASTLFGIEGYEAKSLDYPSPYEDCTGDLEYCAQGSSDAFAKLAFASIIRGMWPSGMYYLIEAIKAKEDDSGSADLILLWEKNELSLQLYLESLHELQGRKLYLRSFNDLPLKIIVQTLFILLLAYEDLGICEAWPVAVRLANDRQQIAEAWENLTPLFRTFCGDWVDTQLTPGAEPLVSTRVAPLVANQFIC